MNVTGDAALPLEEPGPGVIGQAGAIGEQRAERRQLIISYMFLRKTVGWIGTLLPVVLIAGNTIFFATPRPESMSGYYYTHMRNVFIGALCALGVFLFTYSGQDRVDRWLTNAAGFGAVGVAFFPTNPAVCGANDHVCLPPSVRQLSAGQQAIGGLHVFFAAATFIALGFMALRFAKTQSPPSGHTVRDRVRYELGLDSPDRERWSPQQKLRHRIYLACGFAILSCVVLAALSNLLPASWKAGWPLLFIFEALAVFMFGVSWFVKGQTLLRPLKDRGSP